MQRSRHLSPTWIHFAYGVKNFHGNCGLFHYPATKTPSYCMYILFCALVHASNDFSLDFGIVPLGNKSMFLLAGFVTSSVPRWAHFIACPDAYLTSRLVMQIECCQEHAATPPQTLIYQRCMEINGEKDLLKLTPSISKVRAWKLMGEKDLRKLTPSTPC